ncbi:unnamed protein product [Caenorhabditis auriculariae]|uniref:Cyclic nucleotide-binding domain-containing protein n=1 Tax=Caenorhabditis auriculariae TaxID=2777116 RepID=A0A8S1H5L5_9PELO|nr:unnamed protein product [Caenorhabditis auriculariae]
MAENSTGTLRSFGSIVWSVLKIREWWNNARKRLQIVERSDIDEANVHGTARVEKQMTSESWWTWTAIDDTGLPFHLWTMFVCGVCMHPLIFLALSVFPGVPEFLDRTKNVYFFIDGVFLVDLLVLTRIVFTDQGIVITSTKGMFWHRLKSLEIERSERKQMILDVICILPLHLVPFFSGYFFLQYMNRVLKCYRMTNFVTLSEIRTSSPHAFRLFKLIFICFIIFHWNGCLYFYISKVYDYANAYLEDWIFSYDKIINPVVATCNTDNRYLPDYCDVDDGPRITHVEDEELQSFVEDFMRIWKNRTDVIEFDDFVRQYALSFYWSALTLVTLGEQPWPSNTFQNVFEIGDTLLGLVIFAVIVGDVGNMVSSINLRRSDFENVLDGCKRFMDYRKVPHGLHVKAVDYFTYMWVHGGAQVDEEEIAEFLPPRLYGEIAVEIHMETLKRVKLFENCDPRLLYELILKLQLRVYRFFVTLGSGVVFGELSILNIPGNKNGNLRTASVRSKGYSDLYVLDKEMLWEALHEYPEAKASLIEKGRQILAKDNLLDDSIAGEVLDDEYGMPMETKLENLLEDSRRLEKQLEELEIKDREWSRKMKQWLFRLEEDFIEELEEADLLRREELLALPQS